MSNVTRFILLPALVGALLGMGIIVLKPGTPDKPGYAAAVNRAAPAVVNIYTTKITRRNMLCQIPAYAALCQRFPGTEQVQNSLGSGVIVHSEGYILTNEHVVKGADEILVMFANSQTATAEVIGTDPHTDLAVIRVPINGLPVIPRLRGRQAEVGDIALARGNPFGLGHSVSQGIISAFSRTIITDSPYDDFIQTDAAISPGNSGGALVDYEGNLLGINTLIYSQSGGNEGIGFAIPADMAYYVLAQIIEHGRVIRGWLGVSLSPISETSAVASRAGLRVNGVSKGGPAHQAGIRPGDLLLSVNQVPASTARAITDAIASSRPGQEIQMEVVRDNQHFRASAIAAELPQLSFN